MSKETFLVLVAVKQQVCKMSTESVLSFAEPISRLTWPAQLLSFLFHSSDNYSL